MKIDLFAELLQVFRADFVDLRVRHVHLLGRFDLINVVFLVDFVQVQTQIVRVLMLKVLPKTIARDATFNLIEVIERLLDSQRCD